MDLNTPLLPFFPNAPAMATMTAASLRRIDGLLAPRPLRHQVLPAKFPLLIHLSPDPIFYCSIINGIRWIFIFTTPKVGDFYHSIKLNLKKGRVVWSLVYGSDHPQIEKSLQHP
jgi:hypothetical protein